MIREHGAEFLAPPGSVKIAEKLLDVCPQGIHRSTPTLAFEPVWRASRRSVELHAALEFDVSCRKSQGISLKPRAASTSNLVNIRSDQQLQRVAIPNIRFIPFYFVLVRKCPQFVSKPFHHGKRAAVVEDLWMDTSDNDSGMIFSTSSRKPR